MTSRKQRKPARRAAEQFAGPGGGFGGTGPGALELLAAVLSKRSDARAPARVKAGVLTGLEHVEADPRVAAGFARHWPL